MRRSDSEDDSEELLAAHERESAQEAPPEPSPREDAELEAIENWLSFVPRTDVLGQDTTSSVSP